jgi:hypothetical protein
MAGVGVVVVTTGVEVTVVVVVAGVETTATVEGTVTVFASSVTAVWAKALPFNTAPVFNTIAVWSSIFPLKTAVVPIVVCPATTQKTLPA